jgi:hypothetical protein
MFYTDNQGPWNGTSKLQHLEPGKFVGHPGGNRWYELTDALGKRPADPKSGSRMMVEAKRIPELLPPAIYFPYKKMGQSASGIACDTTGGKFGIFKNQMFVGDQTHSTVMRVDLEKVQGHYQGACFPFRAGFGSGSPTTHRTLWAMSCSWNCRPPDQRSRPAASWERWSPRSRCRSCSHRLLGRCST